MRYEIIEDLKQLEKDGFIQELPEKIIVNISLKELCDLYGPIKAELFSKMLNKFLTYLQDKHGYKVDGGYMGGLRVIYELTRNKKNKGSATELLIGAKDENKENFFMGF